MERNPTDFLDGLVHEETQTQGHGVDLTLGAVFDITDPGQIDFGGGEYERPETDRIEPRKRDESDDYGWWELETGTYLVAFNETLTSENVRFVLQPHERLVRLGAGHPTAHVTGLPCVPLSVSAGGIHLKENARISNLLPD